MPRLEIFKATTLLLQILSVTLLDYMNKPAHVQNDHVDVMCFFLLKHACAAIWLRYMSTFRVRTASVRMGSLWSPDNNSFHMSWAKLHEDEYILN